MNIGPDLLQKRQLFEHWLSQHQRYATVLARAHTAIEERAARKQIAMLVEDQRAVEYIYLLMEGNGDEIIPAYIGKSKDPVRRWDSHLKNLALGKKSYARWQERLLRQGVACRDLTLYVIGQDQIQAPPIPNFPVTVGAVEYQLIGLAADAFASRLLNSEGQAR